jgi:hypothetical protein
MSDSRTTSIVLAICTTSVCAVLLFACSLLMQISERVEEANRLADLSATELSMIEAAIPKEFMGWEYEVVSIPDGEWATTAQKLGEERWELVTARRASGGDDKFMYECILKRHLQQLQ